MSKIGLIQSLVSEGLYYLSEHAIEEADADGFDIYDVECGLLTGRMRRTWPRERKYELIGKSFDGRTIGVVCQLTSGGKIRVITIYADNPV